MGEWFSNPATWIIVGISLLSVVIGATWKAASWKTKVDSDRSDFKSRLDSFVAEIRTDIKRIFERLPAPQTVAGASPLRLTELGQRISTRLNAGAIADELVPILRERTEGKAPYEIQEMCFKYIRDEYEPPPETQALILQCAFDDGVAKDGVLDVIAIELRDRLLSPSDQAALP